MTAVLGGTKQFLEFLANTGASLSFPCSVSEALRDENIDSLILVPQYQNGEDVVPQLSLDEIEILAARKRQGFRVYAENYQAYNYYQASVFGYETIAGVCHIGNDSLCAQQGMQYELGGERLLQATNAKYLPAVVSNKEAYTTLRFTYLVKGNFIGTSQIAQKISSVEPMLLKTGTVYSALLSISDFSILNMRPNKRWKKLFGKVFSDVLNVSRVDVETAFSKVWPPIQLSYDLNKVFYCKERNIALADTVGKAVRWHFDAGIVLGDGTKGSVEMILSSNHSLYSNRRVDAGMYTGWTIYAAGKHFKRQEWLDAGLNVFNWFASRCQLKSGAQAGLFEWYKNYNAGPHTIFSIDSGRCGIALINMYKLTGESKYLEQIRRLADAFVNWMDGDLLRTNNLNYTDPPSDEPLSKVKSCSNNTPSIYAEMGSFMTMASELFHTNEYIDVVARIADKLIGSFPNYDYYGHTTSSRCARLLMLLTCIHRTGYRDYTEFINYLIDYLASLQLPCGGIYSEDNITFEGDPSFSQNGENGITTPWDNDRISDQLYCVNNTLAALTVLKTLPETTGVHKEKGLCVLHSLQDYVCKIQIVSDDMRINGGWMRAFDMGLSEYYGLDKDLFWGPYCIMAGWTMGIIPIALLDEIQGTCAYTL